jgi:3-hydroxyacyl-[acyl-carrier-protein] dehydratase
MPNANNDLFHIIKSEHDDHEIKATLGIHKESEILKGHFPGQPVVPGACMLQIVKEVLEATLNHPLRLKKADHLKFMSIIDPTNTLVVQLNITYKYTDDDAVSVIAKLSNTDAPYFKFQGSFIKE